jgi:glycosyltransferase involved in cell wall biosynthesis
VRVLIVLREFYCPSKPIGGAERQALRLAGRLIERGVGVTVVTGQWDWGQPRREKIDDVPVHRHFTGWGMFNIRGLRRFGQYLYLITLFLYLVWHRNEYDLIHCHSALFGASVVTLVGRWIQKETLVRSMASGSFGDLNYLRQERTIRGTGWMLNQIKEADCVVALNKQVVEELVEVGVSPERIVHIPNGVDIAPIEQKTDYRLADQVTVTFVGRLHPQKGVDVLLPAFKKARESLPQYVWHLKLVGNGWLRERLETLASQLSVGQAVDFLGQVPDPYPILRQSDMFVLPSRSEGLSNALLEAMAHGLPCIASDIPGNRDIITPGQDGLLVRLDDDDDLAAAIVSLALDEELRGRLGRAAIVTVEREYSLDSVVEQYRALYARMLQGHRAPANSEKTKGENPNGTKD